MSMSVNPVISIVMGDPAGIGPELIVKVLAEDKLHQRCRPFIIGDLPVMHATAAGLGCSLRFRAIQDLAAASFDPGNIDVLNPPGFALGAPPPPAVHPKLGEAAARYLEHGVSTRHAVLRRWRRDGANEQGILPRRRP